MVFDLEDVSFCYYPHTVYRSVRVIKKLFWRKQKNMSKKLFAMFLVLAMVLSMSAAAFALEPDTYSMIDNFDVTTLDYVYNNKSSNGDYTSNFIEGLLTQDPHGTLIAGMATEWSANEDASEWTFVIRDDAVWSTSSGEEYDAVVTRLIKKIMHNSR